MRPSTKPDEACYIAIDEMLLLRCRSEFAATMVLVCLGCMGCASEADALWSGLSFGFTTMLVGNSFGYMSGGQANPAVTLACWTFSHIPTKTALAYMLSQFSGALFGYFILTIVLPDTNGLCVVEPKGDIARAFAVELFLTCVLIMVWCALWDCRNQSRLDSVSLRLGFSVAACIFFGWPITGGSMNPARTLAPAVFQKDLSHIWLFFGSQFSAGYIMPLIWKSVFTPRIKVLLNKQGDGESNPVRAVNTRY